MNRKIDILKGIHPGKIIDRDLKRRNLSQRLFAASIGEHSQTLNAVICGRRRLTTEMAIKIEQAFGYEEGFLLTLQVFHDIEAFHALRISKKLNNAPNIRHSLFWDTDFNKIDWARHRNSVISRVLERGNEAECKEIARFYDIPLHDLKNYAIQNQYHLTSHNNVSKQTAL